MASSTADSQPGEYYCPVCEKAYAVGGHCPTDGSKLIRLGTNVDPYLGRDIEGKYTIRDKLGQGGMGVVYRAEDRERGGEVAIKIISARQSSDPGGIKRFLREAKLASRLGHPNAVGVIDFGQTPDGACYLVMELVAGRTLEQVLDSEGVFPPERLVRIAAQICDVLEQAHALEIVHRDLKPANVMLLDQQGDFVKVLDFGLAKSVASVDETPVTASGVLIGTPAFMPPEVPRGLPYDGRSDLYSLGVMLYLLGSGRLPFQSDSFHELIVLHGSEPALPMPGVPRALAQVVDRLLRKDPAERYPTAAAVREALERALVEPDAVSDEDPPLRARTDVAYSGASTARSPAARKPKLDRARRWLRPAIVSSLVAAGGVVYLVIARDSPPAATGSPRPPPAIDAGGAAPLQPPDVVAPVTTAPADAAPPVPPTEPATPANLAKPVSIAKPTRPGRSPKPNPTRPTSPELNPAEPVHPPEPTDSGSAQQPPDAGVTIPEVPGPKSAGSGSARRDGLPF